MNNKKIIILAAIAVVAVGFGMFYAGMKYEIKKEKTGQFDMKGSFDGGQRGNRQIPVQNRPGMGMGGGNMNEGGFMGGEILSKDDKSITVKDRKGNSKIIFFSDSTIVGKTIDGSLSDLNAGQDVMVNGKTNADGSITAQNIQIRPLPQQ